MNGLQYSIGDTITLTVNGKPSKARVFGFELWHGRQPDWRYTLEIDEYPFSFWICQEDLLKGCNVVTNGISLKVVPTNEKAK